MNKHYHPFLSLRNVPVEHCRNAFALVLEMNVPSKNRTSAGVQFIDLSRFLLCFSGDTRPSDKLVQVCRSYLPTQLNLLIHESTFVHDAAGRKDAAKKRHSTTEEALDVAQRTNSEACILTHFSQRYRHVSIKDIRSSQDSYPFSWGIAMDGMRIPLTKRALSGLFRLTQCIDTLMSSSSDEA